MRARVLLAIACLASIASVATAAAHDASATLNFTYQWVMRNLTVYPSSAIHMITQTDRGWRYAKNDHDSLSKMYVPVYLMQSNPTFTFSAKDVKSLNFAIDNHEYLSPNQLLFLSLIHI